MILRLGIRLVLGAPSYAQPLPTFQRVASRAGHDEPQDSQPVIDL